MLKFFKSKFTNQNLKKLLWELSEIPFFTAAAQNASIEDLTDLLDDIYSSKPFSVEALKGNITINNTSTLKEEPIINLAKIAINNELNPENQKYLFDELYENKLYSNVINRIIKYYNVKIKIPNHFISVDKEGNKLGQFLCKNYKGESLSITPEFLYANLKNGFFKDRAAYVILFENDLNKLAKEDNIKNKTANNKVEHNNINDAKKFIPIPKGAKSFIQNPYVSTEYKKITYELGEIPYFYAAIQNVPEISIKNIAYLKSEYPEIFNKLISGKLVQLTMDTDPQPLVNLKEHACTDKPSNNFLNAGSLESDICEIFGKIHKKYRNNLIGIIYQTTPIGKIQVNILMKNGSIIRKSENEYFIPNSIKKYLSTLPKEIFSVSLSE